MGDARTEPEPGGATEAAAPVQTSARPGLASREQVGALLEQFDRSEREASVFGELLRALNGDVDPDALRGWIREWKRGRLTGRQQRFVDELMVDENGTQAAIRAGYQQPTGAAMRLKRLPNVAEAIARARSAKAERARVRADDVLQELKRVLFADPRRVVGPHGVPLPLDELPEDVARAIASVEMDVLETPGRPERQLDDGGVVPEIPARARAYVKKLTWVSKSHALALAMKHLGMFPSTRLELGVGAVGDPLSVEVKLVSESAKDSAGER